MSKRDWQSVWVAQYTVWVDYYLPETLKIAFLTSAATSDKNGNFQRMQENRMHQQNQLRNRHDAEMEQSNRHRQNMNEQHQRLRELVDGRDMKPANEYKPPPNWQPPQNRMQGGGDQWGRSGMDQDRRRSGPGGYGHGGPGGGPPGRPGFDDGFGDRGGFNRSYDGGNQNGGFNDFNGGHHNGGGFNNVSLTST